MKTTSQEFGLFIDNLRNSRNMSREDFVEGIVSTRQYHRYLKGETSITNNKIILLVDKLEMNFLNVYKLFIYGENTEYKLVSNIYSLILSFNYVEANKLINQLEKKEFTSKYNKSFYSFCKITVAYNLKRISKSMM